jgi:asparagine synthase (glutamine-hydrolysing)
MSGVVAVLDRSGAAGPLDVEAPLESIAYRGSDGSSVSRAGRAALGHQHLHATPAAGEPEQPVVCEDVHVTLDGRLDDRERLLDALPESVRPQRDAPTDAELVAASYRAWGEGFVERLLGSFAVVVWDAGAGRLVAARDRTGDRGLCYAVGDDYAVVGSEERAVLAHPAVDASVNEGLVAEYLLRNLTTTGESFYEEVSLLPPATRLTVTASESRLHRYWRLDGERSLPGTGSGTDAAALRSLLDEVVGCRLRGRDVPATMMSGGLDSTTVACLADRLLDGDGDDGMRALSMVFDLPGVDDRERMLAVEEETGVDVTLVPGDGCWPLRDESVYRRHLANGPMVPVQLAMSDGLFRAAADSDVDVLLTGFGGDAFSGTRLVYPDLLASGRVGAFLADALRDERPLRRVLRWDVAPVLFPGLATRLLREGSSDPTLSWPTWIADEFVRRVGLDERWGGRPSWLDTGSLSTDHHLGRVLGPAADYRRLATRRAALRHGVDLRHPLLDARVVEFVAAASPRRRFRGGERKPVLRAAAEGVVPDEVRTTSDGASYDGVVDRGLRERAGDRTRALLAAPELVERGFVDRVALRETVDVYLRGGAPDAATAGGDAGGESRALWTLLSTELWLREAVPSRG